jgi:hypothetical protein
MANVKILAICSHEGILETILRLINNAPENWEASGAINIELANDILTKDDIDILLIGSGLKPEQELEIKSIVVQNYPVIKIISHYGGGSGLLFAEIYAVLEK